MQPMLHTTLFLITSHSKTSLKVKAGGHHNTPPQHSLTLSVPAATSLSESFTDTKPCRTFPRHQLNISAIFPPRKELSLIKEP
ncbi:hypothetical protein E2C01_083342 [Portunus trituberculatus]|uniref:Uncharacterized protein n=1 Tax=Portunus trituberculatus TaxID=210409 RepID=A0A5B7J1H7_PORTR|nr:hypothetical protein [Portunus trituberculatus]